MTEYGEKLQTEIVKKQSNGTRKIGNLIVERGGEAVGDEEGTMGERENGARESIRNRCDTQPRIRARLLRLIL